MVIKIIKRGATGAAPVAPIVSEALPARIKEITGAEKPYDEQTPKDRTDWWNKNMPPVGAKITECEFCHHHYIKPCSKDDHATCMNYLHVQGLAKTI